ncbi:MAG TPA: serine/threonine-protein kinase, partial [Phenylobacterium sp.]
EQTHPVQRKVALKLIKAGMDSGQVIARFEAERQALAMMDHANIARVLDAGATDTDRPFFVMELIKGVPITKYCDDNRLTARQRLELFVPVCQAIQHAHQKGIIHRDIKPSNVMVTLYDGKPVPKVIDFGVAKATDQKLTERTLFTQFGGVVGTLEYMSPEQAEMSALGVDTRSDIYSLGVLLYELLTGQTPYDKERLRAATYDEVRRIVREEEPPRPSRRLSTLRADALTTVSARRQTDPKRLSQLFRGELDWVVMKALEKDRNRRYGTASGLVADIQRYLDDEPVQACPPSAGYRLRKFVRRNRGRVLAACLLALALVGGMIGTTWGMILANDAKADALKQAAQKADALKGKEVALTAAQRSERDAKDKLWLSLYEQARVRRFSRQMGQRVDSLDALAKAADIRPDERLRDEAIAALALPDVRPGPSWKATDERRRYAYDGAYRLFATSDDQGVISIRSVPEGREVQRIETGRGGGHLYFSPDGQFVAHVAPDSKLGVWRVAD